MTPQRTGQGLGRLNQEIEVLVCCLVTQGATEQLPPPLRAGVHLVTFSLGIEVKVLSRGTRHLTTFVVMAPPPRPGQGQVKVNPENGVLLVNLLNQRVTVQLPAPLRAGMGLIRGTEVQVWIRSNQPISQMGVVLLSLRQGQAKVEVGVLSPAIPQFLKANTLHMVHVMTVINICIDMTPRPIGRNSRYQGKGLLTVTEK